jgi:hypothetical protein
MSADTLRLALRCLPLREEPKYDKNSQNTTCPEIVTKQKMSTEEYQARIEAIGDQLRAKISSKFQTSTFLAGFGLAVLTLELSTFWQGQKFPGLLPFSISIMFVSICIYIAAVVKFDELTMPKRFWKYASPLNETEKLAYLKEDDLFQLQKRMVFYWLSLTAVATSLTGASLLLMLCPCDPLDLSNLDSIKKTLGITLAWTLGGVLLVLIYFGVLYSVVRSLKKRKDWLPLGFND